MAVLEIKPTGIMRTRVFAVIGIGIILTLCLAWLLLGGGSVFVAKKSTVRTYMADVSGLEPGAPVRISGRPIGSVSTVKISQYLDPQRAVLVDMTIDQHYLAMIPADSITSVGADTLVGDRFVDIDPGKSPLAVAAGGILKATPPEQDADKADLVLGLQDTLKRIDSLIVSFSDPKSQIGGLIYGQQIYDKVLHRITYVDSSIRGMVAPGSGIGKAMLSMDLWDRYHAPVLRLNAQLEAIQKGEGPVGKLLLNTQQYDSILKQVRDLHRSLADANAGKGQLGALTHDDETYRRLRETLRTLDRTVSSLNAGEGKFGELLNNPQTYESVGGTLRELRNTLIDVRQNPQKYLRIKIF